MSAAIGATHLFEFRQLLSGFIVGIFLIEPVNSDIHFQRLLISKSSHHCHNENQQLDKAWIETLPQSWTKLQQESGGRQYKCSHATAAI